MRSSPIELKEVRANGLYEVEIVRGNHFLVFGEYMQYMRGRDVRKALSQFKKSVSFTITMVARVVRGKYRAGY